MSVGPVLKLEKNTLTNSLRNIHLLEKCRLKKHFFFY